MTPPNEHGSHLRLGLHANRHQFALLVLINAFVGAMVGLERTILPLLAQDEFGIASKSAALSFIATFGLVKAFTNLLAARLGDRYGRKSVLVAGWLAGVPVPILVILAPSWSWIVLANVLLGINQGLAWSTTVIMKIDLVGPARRGFAMGLNEFAGYVAVALTALSTGFIAARFGLRPEPFFLGIAVCVVGLGLTQLFVRDTMAHVRHEATLSNVVDDTGPEHARTSPSLHELLARTSWRDPVLSSASHVGLVNNLNDGLAWGLFPLFFAAGGMSLRQIGVLSFVYPATWGVAQLATGELSDRLGRRSLIVHGMLVQGFALIIIAMVTSFAVWLAASVLLGIGTAMVYPTLLATVGDVAKPAWRGSAIGIYRLWRDMGYVVGAVLAGVVADAFGMSSSIIAVGVLTTATGVYAAARMRSASY